MHFSSEEITALAQAEATAPRYDIYVLIHKALRAYMVDTLLVVGQLDVDDEAALAQAAGRVGELLAFCRSHLTHENQFIHPALERHVAGSSQAIAAEHVGHGQAIDALGAVVQALASCPRPARGRVARVLYQQLALFVAHNFEHMHQEETAHNAVLWAHHRDEEIAAIEGAIHASLDPAEAMLCMRWMLPHLAPAERALVLSGLRAQAPAPVFDAVLALVRPHLSADQWRRLTQDLTLGHA
ncbi:hemerythrin domain-containing protein [Ottowia pentelensis]|uniref:Hemerythrin domain-containing protein n=1 Tax=Ottowia pentelensis TaxID=511108 RepID=A0ABV6PR75_9BURK|nr:hemerythrin domain-containing protein [Pseudomonadota bacterium]HMN56432.1 hemerythrin domain-containing protein [Ottowia sp.]